MIFTYSSNLHSQHVPRDQKRNVDQTRKATQQLLELRRQSSSGSSPSTSVVTSPTTPNPTTPTTPNAMMKSLSRPTMAPPPPPPPQRSADTVITTRTEAPVYATVIKGGMSRPSSSSNDRNRTLPNRPSSGDRGQTLTRPGSSDRHERSSTLTPFNGHGIPSENGMSMEGSLDSRDRRNSVSIACFEI